MVSPTNKERLDSHEERIGNVETALGLKPPAPQKSFLKRNYELAINHKGTSLLLAIVLCAIGLFGKYWLDHKNEWWNHDVDGRIESVLNQKDGVTDKLGQIQQTVTSTKATLDALQPFIRDIITHQFEGVSKLSTTTLQGRLPALRHLLTVAKDQGVKTDVNVLNTLTQKLSAANINAPDFWPTAGEFITYRSFSNGLWSVPANLPTCTDSSPTPGTVSILDPTRAAINPGVYENCVFVIDSPQEDARLNEFIKHIETIKILFKHCVIVYRGGPIDLIISVEGHNIPYWAGPSGHLIPKGTLNVAVTQTIQFQDCLFNIVLHGQPPQLGEKLTRLLLANSGTTITLPIS